jgi:hypothetical protein
MTPQEKELLQKFLAQLAQAHVSAKDPEAQAMISRAVGQRPDAAYLLVQRALLLERALQQAKSQLSWLHEQRDGADGSSHAWTQTPSSTPATAPAPPEPTASGQTGATSSGWSGFLANAATTAAGVAGGSLLFQDLEGPVGRSWRRLRGRERTNLKRWRTSPSTTTRATAIRRDSNRLTTRTAVIIRTTASCRRPSQSTTRTPASTETTTPATIRPGTEEYRDQPGNRQRSPWKRARTTSPWCP